MKHPKADSAINSLVDRVEAGEITAEEAAREAPLHRGESIGVIILLSSNVDGVVAFLEANGASNVNAGGDYIEAFVPVLLLGRVSDQPGVLRVDQIHPPGETQEAPQVTGRGPGVHGSKAWNDAGYSGRGIKVGVLDVGFSGFANIMGSEVPATVEARCYTWLGQHSQNLADCSDGGTHGTVVSESVMDIAPQATLYISDPRSPSELRGAVDWMISEGVSVINHSRLWSFDGPGDGTSPLSVSPLNSIDRAVAAGIVWVNAAGNQARGTWFRQGPFDYTTENIDGGEIRFLRFSGSQIRNTDSYIGGRLELRWDDDWGSADTDLDLFALSAETDAIALQGIDLQSGGPGHNPYETVGSLATFDILVAHRGGPEPGWIQLVGWGPTRLTLHSSGAGSIINPAESANPGMLAVGAAPWYDVSVLSDFSSRGPTPDGRIKPDVVAANCGDTATGGEGFCGTSQAAPHVAGMAALVRQRFPDYTPAQVVSYLKDNAEQRISSPDPNNDWGHGFFVLPSVAQSPTPVPTAPGVPTALSVTTGANSLAVAWRAPVQTVGATITAYDLRHIRSDAPNKDDSNWTVVRRVWTGLGSLSHTLTGLMGGTRYDVQVRAVNSAGEGLWSAARTGTPQSAMAPPGAPLFVSVSPGEGSLSVVWNPPTSDGGSPLSAWEVRHIPSDTSNKADANWEVARLLPSATGGMGYSIHDLPGGVRYDVQVRAFNSAGEGPWSATATGTPLDQSVCENSNVVPNASINPQLVADCGTLLALKDTLRGTGTLNWSANVPMRNWDGIRIHGSPLRVAEFRIQDDMTGRVPRELGNLTGLTLLDLSHNQLTGTIPSSVGNLPNLKYLYLHGNRLTGAIPGALGNLSKLEVLYLWSNRLTGAIPSRLSGAASLEDLSFSDNRLTGGIPTELGQLSNLTSLVLTRNSLTGSIPAELANLAGLRTLKLSGNQLTGCIPSGLGEVQENDLASLGLTDCGAATIPGAPQGLKATASSQTQIDLSWRAPARDGGGEITGYRVEVSDDGSRWSNLVVNTARTATRYSHTGLSGQSTRHYRVSAINSAGTGPPSEVAVATVGPAPAPDLVVDRPTVSESAPEAGARFTLNATVRNRGNGRADSTTLRYYQSVDSIVTTGDTEVGTDWVSRLDASASGDESVSLAAPSTPGTYHYGACVDAVSDESDTTNNCSSAATVTVGAAPAPDLVVDRPTVSESAPEAGARFTLNATVRNRGNGRADSTTLRYYQSVDSIVTTGDTEVGTDWVSRLDASASGDESVSLTASSTPGTYYYGACVDAVSDESDTTNNCSSAATVTVGAAPAPDLVVDRPTVSESAPEAGARFTLNATVRNQGNGRAASTTLRYYQSVDSIITTGDTEVGTDWVSRLDASDSGDESVSLTAPATPGTYYYGACVDAVSDESDTANNCSVATSVTVSSLVNTPGAPTGLTATANAETQIDLSWTAPSDDGGSTITGYKIEVSTSGTSWSDLVTNTNSTATSYSSTGLSAGETRYYRVSAINSEGTGPTSNIDSATTDSTPSDTRPCATGGAVTDADNNQELVSDCETLLGLKETLVGTGSLNWSATTLITSWDGISVGGSPRRVTRLELRVRGNTRVTGQLPAALGNLPGLEALIIYGASTSDDQPISLTGSIPTELGNLTNLRELTLHQHELSGSMPAELGNLTNLETLQINFTQLDGSIPTTLGRLSKLKTLSLHDNDLSGTLPAELGSLRALQSLNINLNRVTGTIPVQFGNLSSLQTLAMQFNRLNGSIPAELTSLTDLRELYISQNNFIGCIPSGLHDVAKNDLDRVDLPDCSESKKPAAPTGLTATADGETEIDLSWTAPSDDGGADITGYKIEVSTDGSNWSNLVADTGSASTSYSHTGLTAGSTRHYRVSAINSEGTGPASSSDSATTDAATAPDLVVDSPTVDDSTLETGDSFTLSATVRNRGNDSSGATTLRYYRSTDSTITTSDTQVGTDSVSALSSSGTSNESIDLTAPDAAGTYYYGACVDVVSDESNTTNNCSSGVAVTVRATPDPPSPTPSPTGKAVTGSITSCEGEQVAPGIDSYRITITGTVTAKRDVENVTVEGTFSGEFVGIDVVGDMESGETANFSVTGIVSESVGTCGANVEWLEIN